MNVTIISPGHMKIEKNLLSGIFEKKFLKKRCVAEFLLISLQASF